MYILLITSADRRRLCFRCGLFVCLSVRFLANLWTDFDEILWRGRAWLKDQVIQFWWRSGSRFGSGSPKSKIRIIRIGGGLFSGGAFLFSLVYCCFLMFSVHILNTVLWFVMHVSSQYWPFAIMLNKSDLQPHSRALAVVPFSRPYIISY